MFLLPLLLVSHDFVDHFYQDVIFNFIMRMYILFVDHYCMAASSSYRHTTMQNDKIKIKTRRNNCHTAGAEGGGGGGCYPSHHSLFVGGGCHIIIKFQFHSMLDLVSCHLHVLLSVCPAVRLSVRSLFIYACWVILWPHF